jgi:hypothetical protein
VDPTLIDPSAVTLALVTSPPGQVATLQVGAELVKRALFYWSDRPEVQRARDLIVPLLVLAMGAVLGTVCAAVKAEPAGAGGLLGMVWGAVAVGLYPYTGSLVKGALARRDPDPAPADPGTAIVVRSEA